MAAKVKPLLFALLVFLVTTMTSVNGPRRSKEPSNRHRELLRRYCLVREFLKVSVVTDLRELLGPYQCDGARSRLSQALEGIRDRELLFRYP